MEIYSSRPSGQLAAFILGSSQLAGSNPTDKVSQTSFKVSEAETYGRAVFGLLLLSDYKFVSSPLLSILAPSQALL